MKLSPDPFIVEMTIASLERERGAAKANVKRLSKLIHRERMKLRRLEAKDNK